MKNIINNYSSIEQLTNQYLNKQKSTDTKTNGISFEDILKQQTQPVKFSKHRRPYPGVQGGADCRKRYA